MFDTIFAFESKCSQTSGDGLQSVHAREKKGLLLGNAFAMNASIVTCITDQNSCITMESGKIVAHTKASC